MTPIFLKRTSLLAALAVLVSGQLPPLPRLSIDVSSISCSGISSGADFAVQFQVAHSAHVQGVGVFAGEPYHCAVTRFPNDELMKCTDEPTYARGPGCDPAWAPCDGCPAGTTLIYDHCKVHPEWVNVAQLVNYTYAQASANAIDDAENLASTRVYLYRGSKDAVYLPGSVNVTMAYYQNFVKLASQIYFEQSIPSQHAMPTIDYGSPCGTRGSPPAVEACNYDGAGECLQHIYSHTLAPKTDFDPADVLHFNQQPYFPATWPGLSDDGYVYVPPQCALGKTTCRLHIVFHGCGMYAAYPPMNTSYVMHVGYNNWAAANNMVVLYPQSGGYAQRGIDGSAQQTGGCWDSYGQQPGREGTAAAYATTAGVQVEAVWNMVRALANL